MSVTAKELAKALNLSEAAVSLALNNKPGISTATRQRVLKAAREMGYDFTRKAILHDRKGVICFAVYKETGIVVSDTPFFSSLSEGISIRCKKEQYDLVVKYLYEGEDLPEQIFRLKTGRFSGIILLATEMELPTLRHFENFQTPLVILDSCFETLDYTCVLINNTQGAFLATTHLIRKHQTQPGYLRSSYAIGNFEERANGFYKAIRASGMSPAKSIVHRLSPSEEGAYADMKSLIQAGEELASCYFADNDHIAIGAMNALKEAGYRIPEDIAIVGFDDLPVCEYLSPPLTTVHVPKLFMGEIAAEQIIQILEGAGSIPVKIQIGTTLKKRKSG